jgi:hypothetical protein
MPMITRPSTKRPFHAGEHIQAEKLQINGKTGQISAVVTGGDNLVSKANWAGGRKPAQLSTEYCLA